MLILLLTFHEFLIDLKNKIFARQVEEEEPPIKKLPSEVLGAIFEKLEYEDVRNLKNSSKFLLNAHKLERRMIVGPTCDAYVYYNKKHKLRSEIKIITTRTIPFDQWSYYFKNANCSTFQMIIKNEEIPLETLKELLCCKKSIKHLSYSGKSINQMTIDLLATCKPLYFRIAVNDWSFSIAENRIFIICENIDDVVEAIKFTYHSIIVLYPEIYEKNEQFLMKLKPNTECEMPHYIIGLPENTNEQKIQSTKLFLENSLSNVYGVRVECNVAKDATGISMYCVVVSR